MRSHLFLLHFNNNNFFFIIYFFYSSFALFFFLFNGVFTSNVVEILCATDYEMTKKQRKNHSPKKKRTHNTLAATSHRVLLWCAL